MQHNESRLQSACVLWFDMQYPAMSDLLFAIPNGGKRNAIEAKIMKGEGVRAGIPDLMLACPMGRYHGLFIEMKSGNNSSTAKQKEKQRRLREQNYCVMECRDIDHFIDIIDSYMKEETIN